MTVWRVTLLGNLRAEGSGWTLERFPSRAVALLLARLALGPGRSHSRDDLVELLWPNVVASTGRNRLRQALSTLRRLVEPAGLPGPVILADRRFVRLVPDSIECDAVLFERFLERGEFTRARDLWQGELLPGFHDEWVIEERERLNALREALPRPRELAGVTRARSRRASSPSVSAPTRIAVPAPLNGFHGREAEAERVRRALSRHRLVTLAGPAGVGKTRLAVEVARVATDWEVIALVNFSGCSDSRRMPAHLCAALGLQAGSADPMRDLTSFLGKGPTLLVLDNVEHLALAGAAVVVSLVERLPFLTCLVTSRRVLNVEGEQVELLAPLAVPGDRDGPEEATRSPAVRLFVDRARAVRADFSLNRHNAADLVRLVRGLEGLPLAIEIAASKARSHSPQEMCRGLRHRLSFLAYPRRRPAGAGRITSLREALDWSCSFLGARERKLLARLSVFRGGFCLEDIRAVAGPAGVGAALESLVADSLIQAHFMLGKPTRFTMLESVREFAAGLPAARARAVRVRHRAHFLRKAGLACDADCPVDPADLPNFSEAMETGVHDGDPSMTLKLFLALRPTWEARGPLEVEHPALARALRPTMAVPASLQAAARLLRAKLRLTAGDLGGAQSDAKLALSVARGRKLRADGLSVLAHVVWERAQDPGKALRICALADEAMSRTRDARVAADLARIRGTVAQRHGAVGADFAQAEAQFAAAAGLYRRGGWPRWAQRMQVSRAGCLVGMGRIAEARALLERCEAFFRETESATDLLTIENMRGFIESERSNWSGAVAAGRRCIEIARERRAYFWLALALWNVNVPLARLGRYEVVARLFPFVERYWRQHIGALSDEDRATGAELRASIQAALGRERAEALRHEAGRLTLASAIDLALAD